MFLLTNTLLMVYLLCHMALTSKQSKFIASYQIIRNATQAAINAGYPEKTAASMGCQLMKNPKIVAELDAWKAKKASEITKDDFIDLAISDFKSLELTEANRPRMLDIAGKALGYIGTGANQPTQTLNLTQVNISGGESQPQLWDLTRKLLGND